MSFCRIAMAGLALIAATSVSNAFAEAASAASRQIASNQVVVMGENAPGLLSTRAEDPLRSGKIDRSGALTWLLPGLPEGPAGADPPGERGEPGRDRDARTGNLIRVGAWPFGTAKAAVFDETRDVLFYGMGGVVARSTSLILPTRWSSRTRCKPEGSSR
jgi:hypothetical protein